MLLREGLKISIDGSSAGLVFILANQPIMLTFLAPFALLHGKDLEELGSSTLQVLHLACNQQ